MMDSVPAKVVGTLLLVGLATSLAVLLAFILESHDMKIVMGVVIGALVGRTLVEVW